MNDNINTNFDCENLKNQLFIEMQRREIVTGYLPCALWEYNIAERCQYQYKKLDGKWMNDKTPVRDYRNTVIAWGLIHPDDLPAFNAYCDSLEKGESDFTYEMRIIGDHNTFIKIRYTGKAVCDEAGNPISVVGVTYDITDKFDSENGLNSDADEVTGLLNHKCLVHMKLKIHELKYNENVALVLIDPDNFSLLNKKQGRAYGDSVLKHIGGIISDCFPRNSVIGRLGGDQFALMYHGFADTDELMRMLEEMRNSVKSEQYKRGAKLTVSFGASFSDSGNDSDFSDLLQNAETALYIAKQNGADSFHVFDSTDVNAMPPDCRQLKFSDRFDSGSIFTLSEVDDEGKKLLDFSFRELNSAEDFHTSVLNIFDKFLIMYNVDSVNLVHKYKDGEASIPVSRQSSGMRTVSPEFEMHVNRHWSRLMSLISAKDPVLACGDVRLLKDGAFFNDERFRYNAKSVIICGIYDGETPVGFVACDTTREYRNWTKNEISVFSSIAGMISPYMIRYLSKKAVRDEILYSTAIMESKNMFGYTINPTTYEITYATQRTASFFDNLSIGDICYKAIMGYNSPCRNCPASMLNQGAEKNSTEMYNHYHRVWYSATASRVSSHGGEEEYLLCLTDVTQFMDRVQSHDRLTGLLTFDRFELECMKNFESFAGGYYVVVIKVLRFGEINDDYGFETGNRVLKEIASKLNRGITDGELASRSGSSNFFAILKADVFWKVENRINALFCSIDESVHSFNADLDLCMAAGIYGITPEDKQFNNCLDKANFALKKITDGKFVSRNEIRTYDKEMDAEVSARKYIERNMHSALQNGEFQVYYQPKVDLSNERIYGAEALVRWIQSDGSIISPELFVPIFEENEFIIEMDFYVYDVVLRDMRSLLDEGVNLPVVSLNVSREHFIGSDFPDRFCRLVNEYGIPHEYIELELTETTLINNIDHLIDILNNLRERSGFRISVDDFGAGYSSLNLISLLPVDVLKIDGKFFMMNKMSTKNKKVIETILQLASSLDFDTVSEGVETQEQIDFLKQTNCHAVQGYFYYKPMTFDDFRKLLIK